VNHLPENGFDQPECGDGRNRAAPFWIAALPSARRAAIATAICGAVLLPLTACTSAGSTPLGSTSAIPSGTPVPTPTASSPADTEGGTPRCHTADLSVKYLGSDGGHGVVSHYFALTNISRHDCSLSGTPNARAVDSNGKTLATANPQPGTEKLLIHPDTSTYTSTETGIAAQDENANKAPCNPPAAALWLTPPGETTHLTLDKGDDGTWNICNDHFLIRPFNPEPPPDLPHPAR
jgi:hypothetical protein